MLSVLGFLPAILTTLTGLGTTASSISKNITDLQLKREQVKSDAELKRIDAELMALHDRKDVLVANAGNRLYTIATFGMALGPIIYIMNYYIGNKVIGSYAGCAGEAGRLLDYCYKYRMDGLNAEMAAVTTAALGFFFLASAFGKR